MPVTPPGSGVSSKRTTPNSDADKVWDVAVDVDAYVKRTSYDGSLAASSAAGTPTLKRYSSDASLTSSSSDYLAAASAAPTPTTLAPLEGWSSSARTVDGTPQQHQSGSPSSSFLTIPVQGHGSCGIGIDFVPVDGGAKIVGIAEGGSAALHGGLEVGQVFCSVNGESSAGKSVAELVLMVTGEPGSECTLELQDARGINQSVTIVRNVNMPLDLDRLVIAQERTCTTPEGRVQVEAPLC